MNNDANQIASQLQTSPTSIYSIGSNISGDSNASMCSCISTISLIQDKYEKIHTNNDKLMDENTRLWAVIEKLENENQYLKSVVNHFLKKSATKLANAYLKC